MNTTPVTATVADAQTNEQVTLTASAVSEGSVANYTFTATLADPAHNTPVTVTILDGNNVSHVITIAVGQTTGHVDIASGNGEDVYVDPTSLKAHITNVTGGNFEHPVYSSSDVTATVADTINDVKGADGASVNRSCTIRRAVARAFPCRSHQTSGTTSLTHRHTATYTFPQANGYFGYVRSAC